MSDIKQAVRELVLAHRMLNQAHKDMADAKKRWQELTEQYHEQVKQVTKLAEVEKTYIVDLPNGKTAVTVRHQDEGNGFTVDVLHVEDA